MTIVGLEPAALELMEASTPSRENALAVNSLSIAISLKRIADALHYTPEGTNFFDLIGAIAERN